LGYSSVVAIDKTDRPAGRALETRLWLRLLACCNLVQAELRSRLREDFDTTLARFDVLTQLAWPPEGPTMGELSQRLMVTKANITDVIGRLEAERLVERRTDPGDARVQRVRLTAAGRRAVENMIPAHNDWLAELMHEVDRNDLEALDDLLGRLRSALRAARRV
jgi:DNA-binding MarR family transcriptional regulator